jgi:hypothetical protein
LAELINCVECNKAFSSAAEKCPHCQTSYPKGHHCRVCGEWGKDSEAGATERGQHRYWMHSTCCEKLENELEPLEYACPVCKNIAHYDDRTRETSCSLYSCRKCGHPFGKDVWEMSYCHNCGLPMSKVAAIHVKDKYKGMRLDYYYHKACAWRHIKSGHSGCLSVIVIMFNNISY